MSWFKRKIVDPEPWKKNDPPPGYPTEYRCVDCGAPAYAFGHQHEDGWHDATHPKSGVMGTGK